MCGAPRIRSGTPSPPVSTKVTSSLLSIAADGSNAVPNFTLRAFDGTLRSPPLLPRINFNHQPIRRGGDSPAHVKVTQNEDFHFKLDSVNFTDPDDGASDMLNYSARLKGEGEGGSPLPPLLISSRATCPVWAVTASNYKPRTSEA